MKKILIIEDDRIMRENMAELLELAGYAVEVASDGKEGVEKARRIIPDLIVCDVKMPKLDGFGVLHVLANEAATSAIPFIFVTARSERSDRRKGMEMGADDYLTKPFEDTELIQAVETRLKKDDIVRNVDEDVYTGSGIFFKDEGERLSTDEIPEDWLGHEYQARELIFRIDDYPHYVYFIMKGRVKTFRVNEDGKELISNIYSAGDFFSYQPVLEDRVYRENAETLEDCFIYQIPRDLFLEMVLKNRDVTGKLLRMISKNLSEKEKELMRMAYDSVRKRVAVKLLELTAKGESTTISLLRTDLAALTGTTTETIVRTLTELKEQGILETDGQQIHLLDREKLVKQLQNW